MSFELLPEDIIEYIMMHLTPYGDIQACKLVSSQWYRLATGAIARLGRLFRKCQFFEWYLLQQPESAKYTCTIAERCSHAVCYHPSGQMFVFGGCTAAYTTFNDLWRFDLSSRSWSRTVPIGTFPTPKACATMVEYRGSLLLFGGWSKSSPNPIHQTAMFFNELHAYDPVRNMWTEMTSISTVPHLAGHSATIIGDLMIVFGGSLGNSSNNAIFLFDIPSLTWSSPSTSNIRPAPRYGQSQVRLDDNHLVIVGGCGGPNMIYNDVWLLTIPSKDETVWTWQEVKVTNGDMGAPQLWSHPACLVGFYVLTVSKPHRAHGRRMSASPCIPDRNILPTSSVPSPTSPPSSAPPTVRSNTGLLMPPRLCRKLVSSKSLDEHDHQSSETSPRTLPKRPTELHRASSIPAIIVGEIPKLVVTKEENSGDSPCSTEEASARDDAIEARQPCIRLAASSLLPNLATQMSPSNDRGRRLQMLRRMEQYMHSKARNDHPCFSSASSSKTPNLRGFSSPPPPKSKYRQPANLLLTRNPMCVYVLDLSTIVIDGRAHWRAIEADEGAPENTILYSLVAARGELIMFGGMRSGSVEQQGLDVTPFSHTITNETFILRPPINF